jgi:hypothetical protein
MKKILVAILLLSLTTIHAQINFEKGYFINNNKERTECLIRNVNWMNNPTNFEYKLTADEKNSHTEDIATVTEFGVYDECKYQRFYVTIEKSGSDLRYLTKDKKPAWEKQTLFLKVLVDGDAALYQYIGENIYKYFYQTKTIPINQLICIKYITAELAKDNVTEGAERIATNNQFRQQLYNDVKCDEMTLSDFEKIGYTNNDLVKHFTKFNSCMGKSTSTYITRQEKTIFNIRAIAGINMVDFSINDNHTYFNKGTTIKDQVFAFGAELEYIFPFNKNKWGIYFSPNFQSFKTEKTYIKQDGFGETGTEVTNNVKIDYNYFELPFGIRHYMYLNTKSKLFINAAFTVYMGKGTMKTHSTGSVDKEFTLRSNGVIGAGLGYCYNNKFSVELKTYFSEQVLNENTDFQVTSNAVGIQLGYNFL